MDHPVAVRCAALHPGTAAAARDEWTLARARRAASASIRGARRAVLADPTTAWQRVMVPGWYGEGAWEIELVTGTALWYHRGMPRGPLRWVLVRDPLGRFDPQALRCTDRSLGAVEILGYYVRRWPVEVTFAETRRHLGVEPQRQWSDRAIARTTPILLGLFSLVTLLATPLVCDGALPVRATAWYAKPTPTFGDALGAVRRQWWRRTTFCTSAREADLIKLPRAVIRRWYEAICYAA